MVSVGVEIISGDVADRVDRGRKNRRSSSWSSWPPYLKSILKLVRSGAASPFAHKSRPSIIRRREIVHDSAVLFVCGLNIT